jgi:hypothetical protein
VSVIFEVVIIAVLGGGHGEESEVLGFDPVDWWLNVFCKSNELKIYKGGGLEFWVET